MKRKLKQVTDESKPEKSETRERPKRACTVKESVSNDNKSSNGTSSSKKQVKQKPEDVTKNVKPPKPTKKTSKKKQEENDEEMHDNDDKNEIKKEVKLDKTQNVKSSKSTKKTSKKKQEENDEEMHDKDDKKEIKKENTVNERSIIKKGAAAVDGLCPISSSSHIFCEGKDIWDCMLNQTNIQFNNNKFYIIQLLEDDNKKAYTIWMRWGRVGQNGQNSLKPFAANLTAAKDTFCKKFSDKTRNEWHTRSSFIKVPGKYDLLEMDYSEGKDEADAIKQDEKVKSETKVECVLELRVRLLVELICDVSAMEEAMLEMKYDARKAPLGKLTVQQVKAGYAALKDIEKVVLKESSTPSNAEIVRLCNVFYTRIPHCFGMRVPPLIRSRSDILEKMALLEALSDIQAAMTVLRRSDDQQKDGKRLHPADRHYQALACDIQALDKDDKQYKLLNRYLTSTHGKTHSHYSIELLEVFDVGRSTEQKLFVAPEGGEKVLLWHGSRLTNWAGILSQGLRIAPPEAPSTGYMFGKGIYFADMASKSANYCLPSYQNRTGLLVLCEVALGTSKLLTNADYEAHKLPKGFHSVKGLGKTAPDPKNKVVLDDGVVVPLGPGVDSKTAESKSYSLLYNEYIVYDVSQVKLKYLLKVNFNFK